MYYYSHCFTLRSKLQFTVQGTKPYTIKSVERNTNIHYIFTELNNSKKITWTQLNRAGFNFCVISFTIWAPKCRLWVVAFLISWPWSTTTCHWTWIPILPCTPVSVY